MYCGGMFQYGKLTGKAVKKITVEYIDRVFSAQDLLKTLFHFAYHLDHFGSCTSFYCGQKVRAKKCGQKTIKVKSTCRLI